ncbi:hypothetical protein PT974_02442 [Cladobotryum mycophilum]|uniref:Uncharacterized protein n=1 Tax=Cladobotryum mycophilum TaxID=491253 RepID=A0ABR0SY37_9HYPO
MSFVSPSTWNTLGLGTAAGFAVLGTYAIIAPNRTGELFGLQSWSSKPGKTSMTGVAALVGSRDLTIAAALFGLYHAGQTDAMGTVILSSMAICVVDIYLVWIRKRWTEVVAFTVGTAIWATIGLGLKGYFN